MDGPTGSTGPTEELTGVTGETGTVEGTTGVTGPAPPPPPAPITLQDILESAVLLEQKEAADKATLDAIGLMTTTDLRARLIAWGRSGFPNATLLQSVTVVPPSVCSDGVTRTLEDYIQFCSGKTIAEHVALLQAKVSSDICVGFANVGGSIAIVVTKA